MKEKLNLKDLRSLLTLIEERSILGSAISKPLLETLSKEHLVSVKREGRSYIVRTSYPEMVRGFAQRLAGTDDLDSYLSALEGQQAGIKPSRTEAAQLVNNSKAFGTDVMRGIRLNTIKPVTVSYEGKESVIDPLPGICVEIDEQAHLDVDPEIIVVGVENYATFMRIKDYAHLFQDGKPYLFTYRSTGSKDSYGRWIDWLKRISNHYIHFGDLDKGGLKIYIDSFRSVLGERAEFFIPENYEELIRNGSTKLWNDQFAQAAPDVTKDPRIKPLFDAIEKYHKSCEQEKLARPGKTATKAF
jgi:hypothetical protein